MDKRANLLKRADALNVRLAGIGRELGLRHGYLRPSQAAALVHIVLEDLWPGPVGPIESKLRSLRPSFAPANLATGAIEVLSREKPEEVIAFVQSLLEEVGLNELATQVVRTMRAGL